MSKSCRKKIINARIRWMLEQMGLPSSTTNEIAVVKIAEFFRVKLVGKTIAKKKKFVGHLISMRDGCPTKSTIIGPRPIRIRNRQPRWDSTKYDADHVVIDRSPSERMIEEFYASWEWKRISYDAKIKLGRRCMCCGATPESGAIINTDHIQPIRKYWHRRFDQTNLQILCSDCNMGKGSRDETNWCDNIISINSIKGERQ